MGQYYTPTIIKERGRLVGKGNIKAWFYSHDYDNGLKLMEHSYKGNNFVNAVRNWLIDNGGGNLVWAGDYADYEEGKEVNLAAIAEGSGAMASPSDEDRPKYHYYNNHDKHEFVDLDKCPKDRFGYVIEPLPLLTAEGNGRGGGDYRGNNLFLVGSWSRDFITCDTKPIDGYEELTPDFME